MKLLGDRHFVARQDQMVIATMLASGTAAFNTTLDNAAAVDQGGGVVRIPSTAHGFKAGSHIGIRGSTNYDGIYELVAVAANTFDIYATYVAETFAGTETARPELGPGCHFRAFEVRLHMSDVGAAENFVTGLDSGVGSDFDVALDSQDMNALANYVLDLFAQRKFFNADDVLYWTHANTNARTWGLEVKYQPIDS